MPPKATVNKACAKHRTFAVSNLNDFRAAKKRIGDKCRIEIHSVVVLNWFQMADPEDNQRRFLFYNAIRAARWRRLLSQSYLCHNNILIKRRSIVLCAIILLILSSQENATIPRHPRSCRRLRRNEGTCPIIFRSKIQNNFLGFKGHLQLYPE